MPKLITKHTLPNGLTVLLKEIHSAPIISQFVWYRVGSRNEIQGKTGISHWAEHMQFKGTPRYPAGVLDKAISRDGSSWNAFTFTDWTAFYETAPADKIDLPLMLEADRMINALYDPTEVEAERTVILSELEGNENDPTFKLSDAIAKAAFRHHPYRNEIIGTRDDLLSLTRDDLYHHYRSNYHPRNAVLTLAGDFETERMLEKITKQYETVPSGEQMIQTIPTESTQQKEQRIRLKGACDTTYLEISYHAPAGNEKDFFTMMILDSILTGPSSLNMFGSGGISNKTSRLYRALVEPQLTISISGNYEATIDPHLYTLFSIVQPEQPIEPIIDRIDLELERIRKGEISEEERKKAIKQSRALFAYGCENITNQAYWLGFTEMFADYTWFDRLIPSLENVTQDDLIEYANTRLSADQRVVGSFHPYQNSGGAA